MKANYKTRLYIASLIHNWKEDYTELEELYNKTPAVNERWEFGENQQYIITEKLYGITQIEANIIIHTLKKETNITPALNILNKKL